MFKYTLASPALLHDPQRDATTLPMIRRAIERDLPLLAVCRGYQELNVALGGSLHQHVHELPGRIDHRSDKSVPNDQRYKLAHHIDLVPGGYLNELFGADRIEINSLHAQGIDRTAPAPSACEVLMAYPGSLASPG